MVRVATLTKDSITAQLRECLYIDMTYKLIALDIDGTIRSDDYPLSSRTRNAIDRVREAGALVTVATGRIYRSALRASGELDITTPIASFQGAHIANPVTHEVLWHRPLTNSMTRMALAALTLQDIGDARIVLQEVLAGDADVVGVDTFGPVFWKGRR